MRSSSNSQVARPATRLPAKTVAATCRLATSSRSTARLRAVDQGPGTAWSGAYGADSPLVGFGATPQISECASSGRVTLGACPPSAPALARCPSPPRPSRRARRGCRSRPRRATDRSQWRPIYAVWEITLRCDLACRHCGSRAGRARPDELDDRGGARPRRADGRARRRGGHASSAARRTCATTGRRSSARSARAACVHA